MGWRSRLAKAEDAIAQERLDDAQRILARVLQNRPRSAQAWLLLSRTMGEDPVRRLYCLERAIEAEPTSPAVSEELARLGWNGEHVADIEDIELADVLPAMHPHADFPALYLRVDSGVFLAQPRCRSARTLHFTKEPRHLSPRLQSRL